MHEGRASLTTAIINSLGYGIMVVLVLQADGLVRRTARADDGRGVSRRGAGRAGRHHPVPASVRRTGSGTTRVRGVSVAPLAPTSVRVALQ